MTAAEQGFLLLTGYLGDPMRRPLTVPQFRELTKRARQLQKPDQPRELTRQDLMGIGCSGEFSCRVLELLSQKEQLLWYLEKARRRNCTPITRISAAYPHRLRLCLGMEAPGVLWARGDLQILKEPAVSVVGSRDLQPNNKDFAYQVGKQAALQGYALVSGNARGADRTAQESALIHGGKVISIVADSLEKIACLPGVLYLSEEGYDLPFSAKRALSRNRLIHSLGEKTFVAQCTLKKGGTWDGTCKNLKGNWSPVFCFDDGSASAGELEARGATPVSLQQLTDLSALVPNHMNFMADDL